MPRRPTSPRGPKRPPPADDPVRAQNVLVEEIRSQVKLLAEHVDLRVDGLERKLDDSTKATRVEIADLRGAVTENSRDIRQNSEDIRKLQDDVRQNSEDIRSLQNAVTTHSSEIRGLRGDLGRLRREVEDARQ